VSGAKALQLLSRAEWLVLLLVSCVVGALAGYTVLRADLDNARGDFQNQAYAYHETVSQSIAAAEAMLSTLVGLYQASGELNLAEMTFMSEGLQAEYPYVDAIAYLSWVRSEEREEFVEAVRNESAPTFRIWTPVDNAGTAESKAPGSPLLPLTFIEPMRPQSARYLGVDLLGAASAQPTVERTARTGDVQSLPADLLSTVEGAQLLLKATYFGHFAPQAGPERLEQVSGLFALAIDLNRLIEDAAGQQDTKAVSILDPTRSDIIAQHRPTGDERLHTWPRFMNSLFPAYQMISDLWLGERRVLIQQVNEAPLGGVRPWPAVFGAMLTAILATSLLLALANHRLVRREQRASREAVDRERERASEILKSIGDGVISTDTAHRVKYMNPVAEALTGWPQLRAQGRRLDEVLTLVEDSTGAPLNQTTADYFTQLENRDVQLRLVRPDGRSVSVDHTASRLHDHHGSVVGGVMVVRDVTNERELNNELNYRANHDPLTNLPNRDFFTRRLQKAIDDAAESGNVVGVMLFDLDDFKLVNDTLGHAAGDELLQRVGARLRECLRERDILARLGGDEFAAIVEGVHTAESVEQTAQRALEALCGALDLMDSEIFQTTSIGLAVYPRDGQDLQTLLKNADAACYHAKDRGRNNYQVFTDTLHRDATIRLNMTKHLRRAIERDELYIRYQPQLDIRSGHIVGLEALLRWRNEELGEVSPNTFIRVAEETGLIGSLGEWVLRAACQQNQRWRDAKLRPVRVSVNLSPRQFKYADMASQVGQILEDTGLAPDGLTLEITESTIMDDMDSTLRALHRMSALGVQLAIDDFGTGYSSLAVLKQFPLDALKIDHSFIRDLTTDLDDLEIVNAIIAMGHNLGLKLVAEGVETDKQLELLKQRGCDEIQGYLVSRPLSADDATYLLQSDFLQGPAGADARFSKRTEILRQFHKT
jgi:diguanylate cyclase (GGDEF)-like protein/PAS domain S-box-containing protein